MNKITVLVGLSASGKSTIAEEIKNRNPNNTIIVSSDAIREEYWTVEDQTHNNEVFQIFHKRIKEGILSGKNVIADATNITIKSRKPIIENAKKLNCIVEAYIVPKPYENCISDNINRKHPVPEHVINKQMMNFQIPFYEEGFNIIKIHDFNDSIDYDFIKSTKNKMRTFNQNNPHHNELLLAHCETVFDEMTKYTDNPIILKSCLFHDIGKLFTQKTDENGISHYYQHENVGSYYLLSNYANIKDTMYLSSQDVLEMLFYVNYHMLPMSWNPEKAIKTFGKDKFDMLTKFNECDKIRK